jgi:adenylate kinase
MIKSKIERNPQSKGFIFDGFPRTQTQAQELDKLLNQKSTSISIMLSLKVDNQELIKRLLNRGIESGRADDQNESIIANRIHEYNLKTTPLKEYYGLQKKLHEINGIGSISEIANELNQTIDNL